jgi:hypothetical protein
MNTGKWIDFGKSTEDRRREEGEGKREEERERDKKRERDSISNIDNISSFLILFLFVFLIFILQRDCEKDDGHGSCGRSQTVSETDGPVVHPSG